MDIRNLKKFINDDSWDYSNEEIEKMMEKELEKEPDEINIEFVDACLNYLTDENANAASLKQNDDNEKSKAKNINFKKIIIAAAAAIFCISAAVIAYANLDNYKISDTYVNRISNGYTINYSDKFENENQKELTLPENNTSLKSKLTYGGIKNVLLPALFYDWNYENTAYYHDSSKSTVSFSVNDSIYVTITDFNDAEYIINPEICGEITAAKKTTVDTFDFYLFERQEQENKTSTIISYQIGLTQYDINCSGYDINDAEKLILELK